MKRFFVFMAVFALAFVSIQDISASEKDIPCLKSTDGKDYKTKLKSYDPSSAEKTELNFQDGLFWEMTDWDKSDTTSSCGTWDDNTFDFTFPCEGRFEFHWDMGGPYLLGFYWKQIPNQAPSIGTPTVSPESVEINKDVIISFVPSNIDEASYTTSDEQSGSFTSDTSGKFTTTLKFSSAGSKTVNIVGIDSCKRPANASVNITVNNTAPPTVNCDSLTASFEVSTPMPTYLSATDQFGCLLASGIWIQNNQDNGKCASKPSVLTRNFEASDKDAASYSWVFGDGKTATGKNVANIYEDTGEYTVTLTVKGVGGCGEKTAQQTITVCLYGEYWDSNNKVCCPTGQYWDATAKKCNSISPPDEPSVPSTPSTPSCSGEGC